MSEGWWNFWIRKIFYVICMGAMLFQSLALKAFQDKQAATDQWGIPDEQREALEQNATLRLWIFGIAGVVMLLPLLWACWALFKVRRDEERAMDAEELEAIYEKANQREAMRQGD